MESPKKARRIVGKQAVPSVIARRASDVKAEMIGLRGCQFRRMLRIGLPPWLFGLLFAFRHLSTPATSNICIEWFSGVGSIADAWRTDGFPAATFDILHDPIKQDFMSDAGFWNAINLLRGLQPGKGIQCFATVCSTWVWMSRSSTGRRADKPMGDFTPKVLEANAMVSRMVLMILFGVCRNIAWCSEF